MSAPLSDSVTRKQVILAMRGAERQTVPVVWRALRADLSPLGTIRVLAEVQLARARGEPFRNLPPPESVRDLLSRTQVGPIVLIVRAVRRQRGADAAMRVGREVALAGASAFLDRMVPRHEPGVLASRPLEIAEELLGRFFNAHGQVRVEGSTVAIDVHECHFVRLLHRIGEPDLAPLMCEADLSFFDGKRRAVRVERTQTLAQGASCCDFVFRLDDPDRL